VVGRFEDGAATFYSEETLDDKPIWIRVTWSQTRTGSPRWEQAFSEDRGATWETNWTMEFVREPPESP
jgi:hypothetical protein